MKIKLIKNNEAIPRKISDSYEIKNFVTKDFSNKVSLAVSNAKEHFETTKNKKSDRIYYVLEGKLKISFEGTELIAYAGDVIFIPANTEYKFKGTFRTILVNSPAFNVNDENIK